MIEVVAEAVGVVEVDIRTTEEVAVVGKVVTATSSNITKRKNNIHNKKAVAAIIKRNTNPESTNPERIIHKH